RGDVAQAREIAAKVPGVVSTEVVNATESGEGVSTVQIASDRDVREALCRALVEGQIGLLGVQRDERELESVFVQLAADGTAAHQASVAKKEKRKAAKAKAKASTAKVGDEASRKADAQDTELNDK